MGHYPFNCKKDRCTKYVREKKGMPFQKPRQIIYFLGNPLKDRKLYRSWKIVKNALFRFADK